MRRLLSTAGAPSTSSSAAAAAASASASASASAPPLFDKVLIANRGEIACRVMRTCRRLAIKTVAVYSDADAASAHVALADEAVRLGPGPSAESYLRAEALLAAARATGAQAVHPGYGFLSENAAFAAACAAQGVAFVGPPAAAIDAMGSKANSKAIMTAAGVPVTPGYWGEDCSLAALAREARERVGFPLMIKAVKGGGGKGMRVVREPSELEAALESCQREARASFGSSAVLIERYIERPRHIEFQVFADQHGGALHLWERDCSVQRRHQKVLEEAPAPFTDARVRELMGGAAVRAALAVGYVGAGTVEFMLDTQHRRPAERDAAEAASAAARDLGFYFMEMNTRLQVEHPVTELVTGLDLVEWQLRVASGQRLPLASQAQVAALVRGHAVEARVYAENPRNGFLPATGTLRHLRAPAATTLQARAEVPAALATAAAETAAVAAMAASSTAAGVSAASASAAAAAAAAALAAATPVTVRVDTGVRQGDAISVFYDPMISKLIVHAGDRAAALRALRDALARYEVVGLPNNLDFLQRVAGHPAFVAGGVDTSFLTQHLQSCLPPPRAAPPHIVVLAALAHALQARAAGAVAAAGDPWAGADGARPGLPAEAGLRLDFEDADVVAFEAAAAAAAAAAAVTGADAAGSSKAASAAAPGSARSAAAASAASARARHAHTSALVVPVGETSVGSASGADERLPCFSVTVAGESYVASGTLRPLSADAAVATGGRRVAGTHAFRLTAHLVPGAVGAAAGHVTGAVAGSVPASASALVLHATVVLSHERGRIDTCVWPDGGGGAAAGTSASATEAEAGPTAAPAFRLSLPQPGFGRGAGAAGGPSSVVTPMPGRVVKVYVKAGDVVAAGDPLLVLESMKTETTVRAPRAGRVGAVNCEPGAYVADGKVLVTIEAAAPAAAAAGKTRPAT